MDSNIKQLLHATTPEEAKAARSALIGIGGARLAQLIVENANLLSRDEFSWGLLVQFRKEADADRAFAEGLIKGCRDKQMPVVHRRALCTFLYSRLRKTASHEALPQVLEVLSEIANNATEPDEMRATAVMLLPRDRISDGLIQAIVRNKAANATDAVAKRISRGEGANPQLTTLVKAINDDPQFARGLPEVIRAVAASGNTALLDTLLNDVTDLGRIVRILTVAGDVLSGMNAAALIERTKVRNTVPTLVAETISGTVLGAIATAKPDLAELVAASHGRPTLDFSTCVDKLVKGGNVKDSSVALRFKALSAGDEGKRQSIPRGEISSWLDKIFNRCNTNETVVRAGITSSFRVGCAMYRDLNLPGGDATNHWHAGLFGSFRPDGNTLFADFFEVVDDFPAGKHRTFSRDIRLPDADIANLCGSLDNEIWESFKAVPGLRLHGVRSVNGLSHWTQKAIVATAADVVGRRIEYTFSDMLNVDDENRWRGNPADITELRCDGLVEFAYECNDVRVSNGEERRHWNVSENEDGLEGHNDLHADLGEPEEGELCPRSQGGGHRRNDTTFEKITISRPTISLSVSFLKNGNEYTPYIAVFPRSAYDSNFVRVIVRKNRGPFFIVNSEALGNLGLREVVGSHAGVWKGMAVDKDGDVHDFFGQPGCYEFWAVAVDHGGSVSDTVGLKRSIRWPRQR